jgi:hypothetical protein
MRLPRILAISVIAAFLSMPAAAQAVRTWVSTSGSDTNPCTRTAPCRNFSAAITAVSAGGEVVVLDSGGYGAVTINKAVTLISPAGIHAAIAPTAGAAMTVNGGAGDVIVLRGLYLNSQGATTGISFTAGAGLHLENIVINGFSDGLLFNGVGDLFVKDSLVRNQGDTGIELQGSAGFAFAALDRVRLERNGTALAANEDSRVNIRDSVAARNFIGLAAAGTSGATAELNIENCMVSNNVDRGVSAEGFAKVLVANSMVSSNMVGIRTMDSNAVIRVVGTTITGNGTGVSVAGGSTLASFGNNALDGNGADGAFSATIPLE